ncbi:uncharacterized protein [Eurosta solidaginis]
MFKATNSKMLVGNILSPKAARTTTIVKATAETTTTKHKAVAATNTAETTTLNSVPTPRMKLNNQDNHNERIAVGVDDKHLWHAILGNFNQQNEQRHDEDNNNHTNLNISYGKRIKVSRQDLNAKSLNREMNDVNSIQQALPGKRPTKTKAVFEKMSDALNRRTYNENNATYRAGDYNSYIKQHNEGLRNDNSEFPETHLRVSPPNTIQTTSDINTTAMHVLSARASALLLSQVVSGSVVAAASTIKPTVVEYKLTPTQPKNLQTQSAAAAACQTSSGVRKPNSTHSTNSSLALSVEDGAAAHRKRKAKTHENQRNFKRSNSPAEIKTSKMFTQSKNSTTKTSTTGWPSLNFGALTSITLNSIMLALCNATTVAATLRESISSAPSSVDLTKTTFSSTPTNDFWDSKTYNSSVNIGNSSYESNNIQVDDGSRGAFNGLHVAANVGRSDIFSNDSDILLEDRNGEYIFDRTDVRIIFITLYTLVFCCCVFGNLLVILVVTMSRRLRSITNFFLANLALADFCVGLFCVLQNLTIYLIDSWVFGEFLCRMYQFVHSLSYTASIFILVVICMERYFAIVHPITCKQILTAARLRVVIFTVWVASAIYSTPKFIFSKTIKNVHENEHEEEICVLDRKMFDSRLLDMISFGLLYVVPLLVMLVLYTKIGIALWRSSHGLTHHFVAQHNQEHQHQQQQHSQHSPHQQQQEKPQDECLSLHNSIYHHHHHHAHLHAHNHCTNNHQPTQMTQLTTAATATTTHNINHMHQHNHLQQTLTNSPVVGGVGLNNTMSGIGSSSGVVVGICGSGSNLTSGSSLLSGNQSIKYEKRAVSITESQVSLDSERPIVSACRTGSNSNNNNNGTNNAISGGSINSSNKNSFIQHHQHSSPHSHPHPHPHNPHQRARVNHMSHSSNNVLRARRGVVRMLIIFVLTFALCNLPYHARKMWQYWSHSYRGDSNFNALLTPLTFLVTYSNSAINPLLYAFLSRNFRKGMKELLMCSWRKSKGKSSSNSSMHHKRVALQVTHSLPTDTTHIGNEQL